MPKQKTNEQRIRDMLKDMDTYELAIFRSLLPAMAKKTTKMVKRNPKAFDLPMFNHTIYFSVCDKIIEHCGFEEDETPKS